ncbi:MAG: tRNA pseudouridine(38-40) synthase TruA [Kiritimatiellae bacterium]|nr:tRNA pseudouridine(38-40) synthase TruA [Kiritimatiellia bacterium]
MKRHRIDISYDGTDYSGWQIQPNGITVQEALEKAIRELTGEIVKVHGSGRTDQGVHARRQVAHFDLEKRIKTSPFRKSLNAVLPKDIRILKCLVVADDFHARRSTVDKEYRYFIWNDDIVPPFIRKYRTYVQKKLDIVAMQKASSFLIGEHDFAGFSANPHVPVDSTVRIIFDIKIVKRGSEIVIQVRGNGFLYKMVRGIAGFLIRVGKGKESPDMAREILKSCKRTSSVPTAQAHALFLWNVKYREGS